MSSDRNATLHRNDGSPGPSSRPLTTERNDGCPGPSSRPLTTKRNDGGPGPSSRPLTTKRNDGCPGPSSRPLTTKRDDGGPGPSSRPLTTKRDDGGPGPSSRPLTTKRNSGSAGPSSRPLTIERPSKFQPSVYKGTTGQYFAEPAGDRSDYYWVTVWFHKDIDHRGIPDSTIMMSAQRKIENGDFTIEDQAMHGIGKKCLSIPIKRDPDTPMPKSHIYDPTHPDLLLARNLMDYWNDQIEARKVTLDQRMIFVDTRRKKVRLADMLDVGEVLMDPWRIL
ncbi:hypothetical protein N7536_010929 [Penicillium majusculum]|nr:hypothetical protein N7536_010929 [Penicillium majusculum]